MNSKSVLFILIYVLSFSTESTFAKGMSCNIMLKNESISSTRAYAIAQKSQAVAFQIESIISMWSGLGQFNTGDKRSSRYTQDYGSPLEFEKNVMEKYRAYYNELETAQFENAQYSKKDLKEILAALEHPFIWKAPIIYVTYPHKEPKFVPLWSEKFLKQLKTEHAQLMQALF